MSAGPVDRLGELFESRKCWMLAELAEALGYSAISVRRFLKQVGYFRSYNHNGKWYTLGWAPVFNRDGLWHYEGIGFSRRGSLTDTIVHLIAKSPAGLLAAELADKLHHPCDAVLTGLYKAGKLERVRVGRAFRYLSRDAPINRQQCLALEARRPPKPPTPLSTQAAVYALVEFIKQPQLSLEQIAVRVQKQRRLRVSPESIAQFFEEHGIKKGADTPSRRH